MNAIVVGGGIVGLSCAHALAQQGADVTLCEKDSIGGESTQRSAGGVRTQFSTPVNVDLSLASLEVWDEFEETFGVDIAHRRTGYLFLAREDGTAAEFEANVAMQNERGGDSRYLDPEAATGRCPGLDPSAFVAATYSPLDGFADPNLAVQGYSRAVGRRGDVDVRTKTPVTDVFVEDGTVVGVDTPTGELRADFVVDAAGPWVTEVAAMAGVDLPVEPKRRQILVVEPETPVPEDVPLTIDLDTGSYFRPERDGAALVGGHFGDADPTQDPDGYDGDVDLDWTATALDHASGWTDYFGEETRIKRGWAGLYAVSPDHHPVVGEVRPGFVVAGGFSGHGFMHAPATGTIVAEIVVDGEASLVDVEPLRLSRFEAGETTAERNVA